MSANEEITFQLVRCLVKCIADDKEELSRELFDKIFKNFVEFILISSKVDEKLMSKVKEISLQLGVPWRPTAEIETKFKEEFLQKAKSSFPVIGSAIFRIFDRDGNGTISFDEIMFVFKLLIKLGDSSMSEVPFHDRLQDIADAFFRVFDTNNNGEIETSEVNTIINDIVEGFFNVCTSLFELFQSYVLGTNLHDIIEVYCDRLKLQLGQEPFQLDKIVKFNVSFVRGDDDETLPKMGETMRKNAGLFAMLISSEAQTGLAKSKFDDFFRRFKEQATDDKLGKSECIEIATVCACEMFDAYIRFDQLEDGMSSVLGGVNGMLSSKLPGSPQDVLDKEKFSEAIKTTAASFRSHVLNGGLKRYLACLFDMLDVNNDGILSGAELNTLGRSLSATMEHGMKSGLEGRLADNQVSLYNFMDADSDGYLTRQEIHKFANKACELLFAWVALVLESLQELTLTALPTLTALLFKIKAVVMGGSDTSLTMSDFSVLGKKMQEDREAHRLRWSNKEYVLEQMRQNGKDLEKASAELKADKEVVLAAVNDTGFALEYAAPALKSDKEVVLVAVRKNGTAIQYAAEELRRDRDVVLAALSEDATCWEYIPNELKEDKVVVILAMSVPWNALSLSSVAEKLRGDKEVVLTAVSNDGSSLSEASEALRADKQVVMAAVANDGRALFSASEALRNDKQVVLKAVTCNMNPCLDAASAALKADREVVMAAVSRDGDMLTHAADKFRADKEIVMRALQTAAVYHLVPDSLRSDREIALQACASAGLSNFKHLPDKFKLDKAFILEAISKGFESASVLPKQMLADKDVVVAIASRPDNGDALSEAAENLRADVNVVAAVAAVNPSAFTHAADSLRNDRTAVIRVVAGAGKALEHVGAALQDDAEVVAAAVKNDWSSLQHASERLRGDPAVVTAAMDMSAGQALRHATGDLRQDRGFILRAVGKYGDALEYASWELRGDREVVMAAVVQGGGAALGYASDDLRSDPAVCKAATDRNPEAKKYVCKELGGGGEVGKDHDESCTIA